MLFQRSLAFENLGLLLILIFLAVLTFVSIGLLMCSAFTLSRSAQLLMNMIEYPFLLLTGMIFPVEILSKYINWLSYLLSPTWIMKGFKLAVFGGNFSDIVYVIVIMGTSKNISRASRASNLSFIYSLFLVNFCL